MNSNLDANEEHLTPTDKDIERALRPIVFEDFSGQESVVDNLRVFVAAAKQRQESLDHVLLFGQCKKVKLRYSLRKLILQRTL